MGRAPCCDKANVKKGPWSPEEDTKLKEYIEKHGTGGNWIALPHKAGLKRCGKSCRLRWLNYLRPNIKHGDFSDDEDRIICSLFASIGSRWSIIAAQLPGRTDNDIKNYWNTKLKKKLLGIPPSHRKPHQQPPPPQPQGQCFFLQSSLQNTEGNPYNPPKPLPTGLEGFQFSQDVLSTPHHLHQYPMDGGSSSDGSCTQISYGKERELDMGFESYLLGEIEETQKLLLGGEAPLEYSYEEMKQLLSPNNGCNTLCFEDPISGGASRGDISFRAQGRVMYYY